MTQRNKNIILVMGLLLLLFIAYRYSFTKTIAMHSEVTALKDQKQGYQTAPARLAALAKKEKQLDEILHKNNVEVNSLQNNILKTLNALSEDTDFKIIAFEQPHVVIDEVVQKKTTTYNFTLQGNYQSIINVLYALEQKFSFGNVIQVALEKKKNFRTRIEHLQANILLQRLN